MSLIDKPSAEDVSALYSSGDDYEEYVAAQRADSLDRRYTVALDRLHSLLSAREGKQVLFDVGAGAGAFLERALARGFDACGNEISEPAIQLCLQRHGIRLSDQSLEEQPGRDRFDAMTMWCVLAHVPDPRDALAAALRLLKPGGVLYFHTPRWCAVDIAGLTLSRLSQGRVSHITRRRVNSAHMRLYQTDNLKQLVVSVGFEVIEMRPKSAYSLQTQTYLSAMPLPRVLHRPLARGLDQLVDRDLFSRNVLDVYLRKPQILGAGSRPQSTRSLNANRCT